MTRHLLLASVIMLNLKAADISKLIPYLDINSTATFKAMVITSEEANAKRPDNQKSILMYAIWLGNDDAVNHLLEKGADVNARDSEGVTPLLLAIYKDRTEIALELIKQGADVNATAKDGSTPIIMSTFRENKVVEEAILEAFSK
ncbi:MAG: ankyrin repeat domain-containing protein [Sulfurimonadaceae bacterium]|nr:ankyrin repeat domain-containing protein [Sulfurimonadaceae bacterium]